MNKVYIIKFQMILPNGSIDKETKTKYFEDKGEFIKEYLKLKKAWYTLDLTVYKVDKVTEFDIDSILDF
ncbi:hypothetical protein [Bacillus gaemokensis]|uniref:Uncharacterized protein n=1 Tax=Bacillus gaemokensis TaxID=574375 RepID=A0A073KBG7_9BACI|nr:hypothetical protein [Bacillus gaemokensis]KEK23905.1 hypothetical protein BAGA_05595 [Bacillus gaemokensis]KYG38148.1 hypothetical protein AZF08_20590 [Bacillus gaemokensis]